MLDYLRREYAKQQFNPGLLGLWINPFYFARKGLYSAIKSLAPRIKGKVLDIGCGQKPYKDLFKCTEYVGLELDTPENRKNKRADLYYDGKRFPCNNHEYDAVLASQVLEHVFDPDHFLDEVNRVVRPGGLLLISVPFSWAEHEAPNDYARYSSFGLTHILAKHGFQVVEQLKATPGIRAIVQLANAHLIGEPRGAISYLAKTLLFAAPLNFLAGVLGVTTARDARFYLDNIVLAEKGELECIRTDSGS